MKQNILKNLIEFIIVAFGVFLGILVSNWNLDNKTNRQINRTLEYIINELQSNTDNLYSTIVYHEDLKAGYDSVKEKFTEKVLATSYITNNTFTIDSIPGWYGPNISQLENSIYESAKIVGIFQEIDIKTIQLISNAYTKIENYSAIREKIIDKFLSIDSHIKTSDVIGIIETLNNDVLPFEKQLKSQLEQTIEKLKETIQ